MNELSSLDLAGKLRLFFSNLSVIFYLIYRIKKDGAVGPGLFWVNPFIDEIKVVDLRTVTFDVPPQEILTKVIFWEINNSFI